MAVYLVFLCVSPLLSALLGVALNLRQVWHGGAGGALDTRLAFASSAAASWSCIEVFLVAALIIRNDLVELFDEELNSLVM